MLRARGIDISKWCPSFNPPEGKLDFYIQRLSYGLYTDERYHQHKEAGMNVPVREGYHYYKMTQPWHQQVEKFLELAEGYDNVWWDVEEDRWGNVWGKRMVNETAEALRYLRQVFPNAGLYCNRNHYYLLEHYIDWEWLAEIPLWLAAPVHEPGYDINYFIKNGEPGWRVWRNGRWHTFKRPKGTWTYWQTSFLGDPEEYGITGKKAVDENVFNGTRDELLALRGKKDKQLPDKLVCKCCGRPY